MKNKFYLKIFFVFFLTYLITNFLIKEVFLANGLKVRPNLLSYLSTRVSDLIRIESNRFISLFKKSPDIKEELKDVPFHMVTKGIYGKSRGNYSYTEVRLNETEWIEYTFNIKGIEIKIKVPKGQNPPNQKMLEEISK